MVRAMHTQHVCVGYSVMQPPNCTVNEVEQQPELCMAHQGNADMQKGLAPT